MENSADATRSSPGSATTVGQARVLLTGFEPFLEYTRNPSSEVAKSAAKVLGPCADFRTLPVTFAEAACFPASAEGYDLVVACGVAPRDRVEVEHVAQNRRIKKPDNDGSIAAGVLSETGPACHAGTFAPRLLVALEKAGVDAGRSDDAGGYVCNALYYAGLSAGLRMVFVHVPDLSAEAAEAVGTSLGAAIGALLAE